MLTRGEAPARASEPGSGGLPLGRPAAHVPDPVRAAAGLAVTARAAIHVGVSDGRPVDRRLRSEPPLTLRRAGGSVYLVGSAAGPIGGDRVGLDILVDEGADLVVRSSAAQLIHPGPTGGRSQSAVRARVEAAAALAWLPEPTVLLARCRHLSETDIDLAESSSLVWQETLVLGRSEESAGSALLRTRVRVDGRPVFSNDLDLDDRIAELLGPGGTDGAKVVATTLLLGGWPRLYRTAVAGASGGASATAADGQGAAVRLGVTALPGGPGAFLVLALGDGVAAVQGAVATAIGPLAG